MTTQTIHINNIGDQDATVDLILQLAQDGFSVTCAMTEFASAIKAERELIQEGAEPSSSE